MSESILDKLDREDKKVANFERRIYAYLIDDIIISSIFFAIYWNFIVIDPDDFVTTLENIKKFGINIILIKIIYQTFFIWYYGATIGKIYLGMICLDVTMLSKPKFHQALMRSCFRVISELCFFIGFVWALENPVYQTWHDKLSNTVVCDAS